ncbi:MAG TPA: ABC transporter permease [Ilumatobacteraceae bacterium]
MARFLLRRLTMLIATLLVSSFIIFSSLYLAPGNPIATLSGGRTLPPESVAILEERFHLDEPFLVRYWSWLTDVFRGDLGVSIALRQDVSDLIAARIGTTLALVAYSSAIILLVGIGLGVLSGLRPGAVDTTILLVTTVLAALPAFVASTFLIGVFSVRLGWFPALGSGEGLFDQLRHLTLPAFALAAASLALVARVTRASVREELGREHVQTATSRGLSRSVVIRRHVLRNAAIPITTVAGITIASLIALAAVVERAFSLNGLGSYLVAAAASKDFAVVQAISLVLVTVFVVLNTIVDLLYAVLDPRVQLGARAM